ncbi:hypothetical protein G7Y89_g4966 [Cudoniella acicularis]|uniref:Glucose-methanol-choline oxidoreductase N-terminal domain-containing protein n=1 Tax=Cudoniella acicularis TaxID=354080 RepID=A0A8H4W4F5_9HELO|nr:hypothetical protein G7Y89_g4966 [Cudoniella acicularis]
MAWGGDESMVTLLTLIMPRAGCPINSEIIGNAWLDILYRAGVNIVGYREAEIGFHDEYFDRIPSESSNIARFKLHEEDVPPEALVTLTIDIKRRAVWWDWYHEPDGLAWDALNKFEYFGPSTLPFAYDVWYMYNDGDEWPYRYSAWPCFVPSSTPPTFFPTTSFALLSHNHFIRLRDVAGGISELRKQLSTRSIVPLWRTGRSLATIVTSITFFLNEGTDESKSFCHIFLLKSIHQSCSSPMASGSSTNDILREHIQKPWKLVEYPEAWQNLPETPKKSEICPREDEPQVRSSSPEQWDEYQKDPIYSSRLPHNIIQGPWPSASEYIGSHYQILREDAIAPLRGAVTEFRRRPQMMESRDFYIYTHVNFRGVQLSPIGPAFRVEFSHERAGKRIRWEQSSRLIQGNIVALSPQSDCFQTQCKIAIIAARPILGGLDQNPPQVDLFWGDIKDVAFDPAEEYVMIEARSSYFEASRHMLDAMQKLMTEKFSLANHLVDLDSHIKAPEYVEDHPIMDLSSLVPEEPATKPTKDGTTLKESLFNVDLLRDFPNIPESGMDASQIAALKSMLTKKIAIVQGPPGTGKTFVSVAALKVMLANMQPNDPPIVVSAQTNHALDQLLNHVLAFEPNILRLGGRSSKENKEILKRTLYELRKDTQGVPSQWHSIKQAKAMVENCIEKVKLTLTPLTNHDLLDLSTLLRQGIITQAQHDSLEGDDWEGEEPGLGLAGWLPADQLSLLPRTPPVNTDLEMEEGDIEQEQLQELEAEAGALTQEARDSDREALKGTWLGFSRTVTGRDTGIEDREVKKLLTSHSSLHNIPLAKRGNVYRYFVHKLNSKMRRELKTNFAEYKTAVENARLARWSANVSFVKHIGIKLIGCTTTGLSKYRGILAALEPRTILIEEAAETLEGTIIAGMLDSLQHLILVGDHQQLQAGCNVGALEVEPYYMGVSMFERLVNNSIGYIMLDRQRRMIPDIRKLLCIEPAPFYKNLRDHPSVLDRVDNRPPVPGMGGCDTYFFHHNWPEARNADSSKYNLDEAHMIAGMFSHMVLNGVEPSKITVLTFYNGQRKAILKELKNYHTLRHITYFNCFTVDSYQGEENDIILLSLVRSNFYLGIGFLDNKNRLVVALSRARRGLYMFGNALTLCAAESTEDVVGRDPLWNPLVGHLRKQGRFDLDGGLPITCSRHNKTVMVYEPDDWVVLAGGCNEKCRGTLDCGHPCPYTCHPFEHSQVACREPCPRFLPCGHGCSNECGVDCVCLQCDSDIVDDISALNLDPEPGNDWDSDSNHSPGKGTSRFRQQSSRYSDVRQTTFANTLCNLDSRSNSSAASALRSSSPKPTLSGFPALPPSGVGQNSFVAAPRFTPQAWQEWNAQKADAKFAAKITHEKGKKSNLDPSNMIFNETYQQTAVNEGGRRVKTSRAPIRRKKIAQIKHDLEELESSYDYIVVGGGTSGLTVADRLSEDGTSMPLSPYVTNPPRTFSDQLANTLHKNIETVLVIEYGSLDTSPDILMPSPAINDRNMSRFYDYYTVPQPGLNNQPTTAYAAAIVGGGSAVDHMMFDRGARDDYDNWEKLGNEGWGWDGMLPYFRKSVNFTPPSKEQQDKFGYTYDEAAAYGGNGPIHSSYPPFQWPQQKTQWNAWLDLGIPPTKEGASGHATGLFWIPSALNPTTETRSYSVTGHYFPASLRKNYHLLPGYQARNSSGINSGDGMVATVGAKQEIVLAAGSFGSPVLLQRSGVGPKGLLEKAGIEVKVDLPGVGRNLQDHAASLLLYNYTTNPVPNTQTAASNATFAAEVKALYEQNRTGPLTVGYGNSVVFLPLQTIDPTYLQLITNLTLQNSSAYLPTEYESTLFAGYSAQKSLLLASYASNSSAMLEVFFNGDPTTTLVLQKPLSRGTVSINTTSPFTSPPIIDPKVFLNPLDMQIMISMLKFGRKWFQAPSQASLTPVEVTAGEWGDQR